MLIEIYQLAFTIPGMSPWFAISLKQRRESLNFLKNPLALPVNWHRFFKRTGDEFFGILFKESTACKRSSIGFVISKIIPFKALRLSQPFRTILSRFFCLAIEDFFAMIPVPYFFLAGPFWRCLRLGSFLLIT